jgi:glycosyltransferase involved in cell wall biosynthesis
MLSIITVVLNDRDGLEKTLNSLMNEDKNNYEHILIDGGSVDGTVEYIKTRFDRIDCLVSEPDKGIYDAMNKGVGLASGAVISFLNAGDLALNGYVSCAEKCTSGIDYCYSGIKISGKSLKSFIPKKISSRTEFLQSMPFPHPGLFAKKDLFYEIGFFNLNKKITADHEWVVRLINADKNGIQIEQESVKFQLDGLSLSYRTPIEMFQTALVNKRGKFHAFVRMLYGMVAVLKYKLL